MGVMEGCWGAIGAGVERKKKSKVSRAAFYPCFFLFCWFSGVASISEREREREREIERQVSGVHKGQSDREIGRIGTDLAEPLCLRKSTEHLSW